MTTLIGIAIALLVFVGAPVLFGSEVSHSGSDVGASEAREDVPYGRDGGERLSASSQATIGDGSVTQSGRVGVRSLSSAITNRQMINTIRVGHLLITERSLFEVPQRPEPQPWPTTRWTCTELATALRDAGMAAPDAAVGAAIAVAESGGRSDALNVTTRERSVGPFQINLLVHRAYSESCVRSLSCSAAVVMRLSSGGRNWNPWTVFRTGAYEGRCA